jgi:hypothetical protein
MRDASFGMGRSEQSEGGGELVPHVTAHREGGASCVAEAALFTFHVKVTNCSCYAIRYFHYSSTLR